MSIHRQPQNEITERMKTMKKILSGFLLLLMLVSVLGIPAGAADAPDVMTAGVSVDEETGAVSLTLTAAQDTVSGRITVGIRQRPAVLCDVEMTGRRFQRRSKCRKRGLRLCIARRRRHSRGQCDCCCALHQQS